MGFRRIPVVPLVAVLSLAGVVLAAAVTFAVRDRLYAGEPLPGVRLAQPRLDDTVDLVVGNRHVQVEPATLLRVDEDATRSAVLAVDRDSTLHRAMALLLPFPPDRTAEPVLRTRPAAWHALLRTLDRYEQEPRDAAVAMRGLEAVVRPGQNGTRLDRGALLAALLRSTRTGESTIEVPWHRKPPPLDDAAAGRAAAAARALVSAPIELRYRGRPVGSLRPGRVARLIRFVPGAHVFRVRLDEGRLERIVRPLVHPWARAPVDASFRPDGKRVHVVPARYGLDLDAHAAAAAVLAAGRDARSRAAPLRLKRIRAHFTTAAARRLGIRTRLAAYTTTASSASPAAAARDAGLLAERLGVTLLRPKQTFSFDRAVGEATTATGFPDGPEKVGRILVPATDAAVTRAATAVFLVALRLGLPVLERHNYPVYLADTPPGRDATAGPDADLRFRNDRKRAILVAASASGGKLTVAIYGTRHRELVRIFTSQPSHWRSPPIGPGGVGQDGFDVAVSRTVTRRGRTHTDTFASHYESVGFSKRPAPRPAAGRPVLPPR